MRRQIGVIGAGIAGIAAAREVRRQGVDVLLLDRALRTGGRLDTLWGSGWQADVGAPGFRRSEAHLRELVAEVGLATDVVALQDAVVGLRKDGVSSGRSFDADRVVLRGGWESLLSRSSLGIPFRGGIEIDALHWSAASRGFEIRNGARRRAVPDEETGRPLRLAGLVLAVPGPEAAAIASRSQFLRGIVAPLSQVRSEPSVTAIFVTPSLDPGWCLALGEPGADFRWITLEDRIAAGRVQVPGRSVVVACAGPELSRQLMDSPDAEAALRIWAPLMKTLKTVDAEPIESRVVRTLHGETPQESLVQIPEDGVPTQPGGIPFGLAGGWTAGPSLDDAVRSGERAARNVLQRLRAAGG